MNDLAVWASQLLLMDIFGLHGVGIHSSVLQPVCD